ncbi:MAG: ABC transporter ATP-binding protein [Paramuribaculum sp.]|nr:ABC transporter ATP-binding protein [Paramuribaculum sp.]
MIRIENITFSYKRNAAPVLNDFSLQIPTGGIYGLLGKNGAGKSTLLYLIAGLLTPSSGQVSYNGIITRKRKPETLREIFIVPEEFSLPSLPLREYVKINSRFYPNFSAEDMRRNLDTFELSADVNLNSLSMGQKKKAFMCFALACNTSLMLFDEPTNGLDIPGKSQFRKFIVSSMTDDRTIVISTHQVRDIDRILDHVIITDNRSVVLDRPISDILSRLRFLETDSKELIEKAIYKQISVRGADIILPNDDGADTQLNLETLFDFAMTNPQELQSFFTSKSDSK